MNLHFGAFASKVQQHIGVRLRPRQWRMIHNGGGAMGAIAPPTELKYIFS